MSPAIKYFVLLLITCFSSSWGGMVYGQKIPEAIQREIDANLALAKSNESQGNLSEAAMYYGKVAKVYWVNNQGKQAINHYEMAASLNIRIGNSNALRTIYGNMGVISSDQEEFENAIVYFQKSLTISKKQKRKADVANMLVNIGSAQLELNRSQESLKSFTEANALALELNDLSLIKSTYGVLAEVETKLGHAEKSAEYFNLYSAFSRRLQRDQMALKDKEVSEREQHAKAQVNEVVQSKLLTEEELQQQTKNLKSTKATLQKVELISKEKQLQINLLSKQRELQQAQLRAQAMVRNAIIGVVIFMMGIAGLILYGYNQKRKANHLLEKQNIEIAAKSQALELASLQIRRQNDNITSSINYAQRIQEALLPTEEGLQTVIPESFVFLQPRDIVSGDFHWFSKSHHSKNTTFKQIAGDSEPRFFITAADCTGHGVPGAFMSMIGVNLLENITRSGGVVASDILNELHRSVRFMLKQYKNDNRDGMEIAFCVIRNQGKTIEFAGARNPLILIKNGELTIIKGDAVPVGGSQNEEQREFTLHTIDIDCPTSCYIFSDGILDQFGGPDSVKFTSRRLRDLLLSIHQLPMAEQKVRVAETIKAWMGLHEPQLDDMLLMGFRLGDDEHPVNLS
ncbi:SpoIIE family protein phosphatase [Williamwhitmania taraxaci]|uniref:Serine phosphatase RsbU, regulator of sigma subunit n=1 Tax=Williamwhitmania taraxaci TaxID=1640674 RepID=A0A1G6MQ31_9BACT|nr:SpoIIE family protein phosphatase [Williamwhitmania taraxaci]SDC57065.1 Serine phosphatase RsbU, regulator of sigma subunit [Williamwhitmania taraxaci]